MSSFILKDLNIPLSPHNPNQSETSNTPKGLASSGIPKTHIRDSHHVIITPRLNVHHSCQYE